MFVSRCAREKAADYQGTTIIIWFDRLLYNKEKQTIILQIDEEIPQL